MKKSFFPQIWACIVCVLILSASVVRSQDFGFYSQPKIVAGGSAALFRISLDRFTSVYKNRIGPSYGGFAGLNVYGSYYALVKYRTFQQDGKETGVDENGIALNRARWQETWYTAGVRVHPPIVRRVQSYYGFGFVFYDIKESRDVSIYNSSEGGDGGGTGFYLELGVEYFPFKNLAAFFEMEIGSGGQSGKTGFEAFSVGGFRFALGLSVWLF